MQNFGQNNIPRTNILNELQGAIAELGEAFAMSINNMVVQSGITNPKAEIFEIVPKSWKKLAAKNDKTKDDINKLDEDLKNEIYVLSKSYLLFIAKNVQNKTGIINYQEYEQYLLKYRFGHYNVMNQPEYLRKVKTQILNAFNKISSHGQMQGDNLIDKDDMAAFIYAIALKSVHDANDKFCGFTIDGNIEPENYAVCEHNLFEPEDNIFSVKLRIAYKFLNNEL